MRSSSCSNLIPESMAIPNDILLQILSLLPPMKLYNLCRVSKSWRSLINNHMLLLSMAGFFYQRTAKHGPYYLNSSPTSSPPLGRKPWNDYSGRTASSISGEDVEVTYFHPYHRDCDCHSFPSDFQCRIIDCCNGLVLCHCVIDMKFFVSNPITKRFVLLPKNPDGLHPFLLAFDPRVSPHYNVVALESVGKGFFNPKAINVYSSKTRKWGKKKTVLDDDGLICDRQHAAFCNDAIYIANLNNIVRFDLSEEEAHPIVFPNDEAKKIDHATYLGRMGGKLCYARLSNKRELIAWSLEEEDRWTLKHKNTVDGGAFGRRILGFHPFLELVFVLQKNWVFEDYDRMCVYDLNSMVLHQVCEFRSWWRSMRLGDGVVFPFFPTVISALDVGCSSWKKKNPGRIG